MCERSAFRTATVNGTVYFGPWSLIASALSLDRPSLAQLRAEFPCAFQPLGDGREFAVSSVGLTDIACAYGRAVQLLMSVPETPKYACPLRAFDRWLQQPRVCARPWLIRAVSCVWSADTPWLPEQALLALFGAQNSAHPERLSQPNAHAHAQQPSLDRVIYDFANERIDGTRLTTKLTPSGSRLATLTTGLQSPE